MALRWNSDVEIKTVLNNARRLTSRLGSRRGMVCEEDYQRLTLGNFAGKFHSVFFAGRG